MSQVESQKLCHICQDYVDHFTPNCPKLICAECDEKGHSKRNCPYLVEPEVSKENEAINLTNENGQASKNCPLIAQGFPYSSWLSYSCELKCVEDNIEFKQFQFDSASKTYIFIKAQLCAARTIKTPPINKAILIVKSKAFPSEVNLVTEEIKLKHSQLEVFDIVILINKKCINLCSHDIIKYLYAKF